MRSNAPFFVVDTNVLVYAYDLSHGRKQDRAIEILERLEAGNSGALSVQILGEFYVTVTRKLKAPLSASEAERRLTNYARWWLVYDLTAAIVLEAARGAHRYQFPYWDSLIWATAKLGGVPNVLSEDFNDGSLIEGVRFLNPFIPSFDLAVLTVS